MRIVEPKVEIITPIDGNEILKHLEQVGRVCYRSEDRITPESAEQFVAGIIKRGHEAVIEHFNITVKFVTDRGISHEIVRHRIASYAQESTRYCVAGSTKLQSNNPHNKLSIGDLYTNIQSSKNGAYKRIKIKQLNEDTGELQYAYIKNIFKVGNRSTYRIKTNLGYILECTSDHEIYTPNGYVALNKLKCGDKIYVNGISVNSEVLYKNREWLYYQNITLNKTFTSIAEEFNYNISTVKKWARKLNLPKKGTGYFNLGKIPWNKGLSETDDIRVKNQADALRKYHCDGRHDGEKIILKEDTKNYWKHRKDNCAICKCAEMLEVHHKDENRDNNKPANLITLCKSCHQRIHSKNLEIIHADSIISIEKTENQIVYDVEMNSKYHNFIANGVVVHNCNYSNDKFDNQISVIEPIDVKNSGDDTTIWAWFNACEKAEEYYFNLIGQGCKPQTARSVLPTCTKTEIMVTMNLREWRHFIKLRAAKAAHPDMRLLALDLLRQFKERIPVIFDDIKFEEE